MQTSSTGTFQPAPARPVPTQDWAFGGSGPKASGGSWKRAAIAIITVVALAARVWPPELDPTPADLEAPTRSPSLRHAKLLWTAALARTPYQWAFGNQLLYGVRDEALFRKDAIARQKEQLSMAVEAGKQAYRESVSDGTPNL